jgi:hypothetical protein
MLLLSIKLVLSLLHNKKQESNNEYSQSNDENSFGLSGVPQK